MWHKYTGLVAVLSLAGLAAYGEWWLYDFGKLQGAEELKSLRAEHSRLAREYRELRTQSDGLRQHNAVLERSSQIDQQAARDIQEQLASLQEELQAAREEIEFYRGIVAPGDVASGLRIHRFKLTAGLQPGEFHYDLVLTQLKRNDRVATGRIEWKIIGKNGAKRRKLKLSDVTRPQTKYLDFRFRYFQHLTGVISLPPGFQGQRIVLSIKTTGKDAPDPIEQGFAWPVTGS
jgi:hypothetical protein